MTRARLLRRVLIALALLAALSAAGWLGRGPILRGIGHQLVHADPLAPSGAIVVLAGGVFDREVEGADLYARGLAPIVILTREPEPPVLGALRARGVRLESSLQVRRRVLRELGVPDAAIELVGPVRSTFDEAHAVRQWAEARRAGSVIVVTSAFHTARTRFVFERVFEGTAVTLRVTPASLSEFAPDTWWTRRNTLREGLFEWQKLLFYRVRY